MYIFKYLHIYIYIYTFQLIIYLIYLLFFKISMTNENSYNGHEMSLYISICCFSHSIKYIYIYRISHNHKITS